MSDLIRIKALGGLPALIGRRELALDRESMRVKDLFDLIAADRQAALLDSSNTLVLVDGVEISALEGEETMIRAGSVVLLIPVAHGGRQCRKRLKPSVDRFDAK